MKRKEVGNESTLVSMFQKIQAVNVSDTVWMYHCQNGEWTQSLSIRLHSPCSQAFQSGRFFPKPFNPDAACDTIEILLTTPYQIFLPGVCVLIEIEGVQ